MKTKHFGSYSRVAVYIKNGHNIAVLGASAGGFQALKKIVSHLDAPLQLSLLVVIHRLKNIHSLIGEVFSGVEMQQIKEAVQGEALEINTIYVNPADYHMKVSEDMRIELSHSEPINYSRPSIDYTMSNVAGLIGERSIGIVLTGANIDGADGLRQIHDHGGRCVIQDPREATYPQMPEAAVAFVKDAQILQLRDIAKFLQNISLD